MFILTAHAVTRYQERFAGNASFEEATQRLQRVARQARRRRELPGCARLYSTDDVNLVVADGTVLTVYRIEERL